MSKKTVTKYASDVVEGDRFEMFGETYVVVTSAPGYMDYNKRSLTVQVDVDTSGATRAHILMKDLMPVKILKNKK